MIKQHYEKNCNKFDQARLLVELEEIAELLNVNNNNYYKVKVCFHHIFCLVPLLILKASLGPLKLTPDDS